MKMLACALAGCLCFGVFAAPQHGNNPDTVAIAVLFGVELAIIIDPEFDSELSESPCSASPSDPSNWMNDDCLQDMWVGSGQSETCLHTCLENCKWLDENCDWTYAFFATCNDLCWDGFDG